MVSIFFLKSCPIIQVFSNFSRFIFQFFKIYFPIFQVSQANICPESCKRSQICAASIPGWILACCLLCFAAFFLNVWISWSKIQHSYHQDNHAFWILCLGSVSWGGYWTFEIVHQICLYSQYREERSMVLLR